MHSTSFSVTRVCRKALMNTAAAFCQTFGSMYPCSDRPSNYYIILFIYLLTTRAAQYRKYNTQKNTKNILKMYTRVSIMCYTTPKYRYIFPTLPLI